MKIIGIDPGLTESGWVYLCNDDGPTSIIECGLEENADILALLRHERVDGVGIEGIAPYGQTVGWETFGTILWIGRIIEVATNTGMPHWLLYRKISHDLPAITKHLCGTADAKDSDLRHALIERFGGSQDVAIGKKATPGPLYTIGHGGHGGHCWAALAVAVTLADWLKEKGKTNEL